MTTIDARDTLQERDAALRVREALLALLRSWEDMHDLPRSVPTRIERGLPRGGTGHTKRYDNDA